MPCSPPLRTVAAALVIAVWTIPSLGAQKPRNTELWLDSLPADSVNCGGLTVQFARFFKDNDKVNLLSSNAKGTERNAIDIWIWNRSKSPLVYDPHMFAALDQDGAQISFWNSEEIGTYMAGRGFLLKATSEAELRTQRELNERNQRETQGRKEYSAMRLLPGASGGRKILVPDNDKKLERGITVFCGDRQLGLLHKPNKG